MTFTTAYSKILGLLDDIDPVLYGKTRNFIDGAVTRLSPYISRGVISTRMVMEHVLEQGYPFNKIEKFIQELAWRDYWQQIWIAKRQAINQDIKRTQPDVSNHKISRAIIDARTGIEAIDNAISGFYKYGYLHNHVRMYIASIACNVGRSHWFVPARWMYYHLIDGDWASNALSWQWVAGANSGKKYYANQENVNKYCHTEQSDTFLDIDYSAFQNMVVPDSLSEAYLPELLTPLPDYEPIHLDPSKPVVVYNYYNLDPTWKSSMDANRVLLIEPSVFLEYPVSQNAIDFMINLSKNIVGIQTYVGEFHELASAAQQSNIFYKEHPLNQYQGNEESRDWMFTVKGYFPSFYAFWKKCKKELKSV